MATYEVRGKVVLITGGAKGIGHAIATQLHAAGASVMLVDLDPVALKEAADRIGSDRVAVQTGDVRDRERMREIVETTVRTLGRVDVVVANAGITPPPGTLRVLDFEHFQRVMDVNTFGVLHTVQPAIEELIATRGHIVVVSSAAAFSPPLGASSYMASKAATEQIGRALRLELAGFGVSVGVAYFGLIDTDLAKATLDDDPVGRKVGALLPWPFTKRATAETAAASVVEGIAGRKARTMAPKIWWGYAWFRGLLNPLIDVVVVRDKRVRSLIGEVEARYTIPPRITRDE